MLRVPLLLSLCLLGTVAWTHAIAPQLARRAPTYPPPLGINTVYIRVSRPWAQALHFLALSLG